MTAGFEECFKTFAGGEQSLRKACDQLHFQMTTCARKRKQPRTSAYLISAAQNPTQSRTQISASRYR